MQVLGAINDVLVGAPASGGLVKYSELRHYQPLLSDPKSSFCSGGAQYKRCRSFYIRRLGRGHDKSRTRGLTVRASEGDSSDGVVSVAPLLFESPPGQLLAQILQTHRHLFLAAAEQQLENLQTERDAEKEKTSSPENLLYKNFWTITSR